MAGKRTAAKRALPDWRDFFGLVPSAGGPKARHTRPDPGASPDADGKGGRCPQPAPARGGIRQEPGLPVPAPPPPFFEPARGQDTGPLGELMGIAELSRLSGISRATLFDWITDGHVPLGTHEHPTDFRCTNQWTSREVQIILLAFTETGLVIKDGGKYRKTRLRPSETDLAPMLAARFNALWASQAAGDDALVQGSGDCRALLLPEVRTISLADGSRVVPGPPVGIRDAGPAPVPDLRAWNAPSGPVRPANRRPHRNRYTAPQAATVARPRPEEGSSARWAPMMPRDAGMR